MRKEQRHDAIASTQQYLLIFITDELGLVSVFSLLENICHEKAQQTLRLWVKGATLYTAWNKNAFLLRQLMTRLRPTLSYDPDVDPTSE